MPKIPSKYRLEVYEGNNLVSSSLYPTDKAMDKMLFYIECAIKIRFHNVDRFRLVAGNHIIFEFRDLRKITDQKEFIL